MKFDKTCGTCAFGHHLKPIDLSRRHCHGAPPQVLALPQQRVKAIGKDAKPIMEMALTLQNMRPIVNASDPQCALYQPRTFEDVEPKLMKEQIDENMKALTSELTHINA